MHLLNRIAVAVLLICFRVGSYLLNGRAAHRPAFRDERVSHHWDRYTTMTAMTTKTARNLQASPWEDLAAEWAARNRDDESHVRTTVAEVAPRPMIADVADVAASPEPMLSTAQQIREAENVWKEIDEEVMAMQREAEQALLGLEKMQEDIDVLATDLVAKDENYAEKIRDIERRGSNIESDLRRQLKELSKDFDAYRTESEEQNQAFRREAEGKQEELRTQISRLQRELDQQISMLQSERSQSSELRYEKERLLQDLENYRVDNAEKLKRLEARFAVEQDTRTREREEFDERLQRIQEEASKQLDSTIEKFQTEKQQIERDYSSRLEKVSAELRVATTSLAEAQRIIQEKQSYIDTLEPVAATLDAWTQESWYQLNRLQDAVGLPVTPTDENDEIPGIEVLEAEVHSLIDHLRSRERYFEDAIFDIQTEMQDKEEEMNEKLEKLEQEYQHYRSEMEEKMTREDPAMLRKEMQDKLETLGSELKAQRALLVEELARAQSFMDARIGVERELDELKREASFVIDRLESQLRNEQEARRKDAEDAERALEDVGEASLQNINKVVAQGQERVKVAETELSTRVAQAERDLRISRFASGIFLSVALTSAAVAGLLAQGVRNDPAKETPKAKNADNIVQKGFESPKKSQTSPFSFQFRPEGKTIPLEKARADSSALSDRENNAIYTSPNKEGNDGRSSEKTKMRTPTSSDPLPKTPNAEPTETKPEPAQTDGSKTRTYFAIKEGEEASSQTSTVPDSTSAVDKETELAPEMGGDKPRAFLAIKEGGGVLPQDKTRQASTSPSTRTEPTSMQNNQPSTPDSDAKSPTSEAKTRTFLAIKDEGMVSAEKTDSNVASTSAPKDTLKSTLSDPSPESEAQSAARPRTYLAIKDDGKLSSQGKKDKKTSREIESSAAKDTPSTRPAVTAEDNTPSIDWETLTYKWLDEVEDIRSSRASSRINPAAHADTQKGTKEGIDETLNNPLLQQALAPASPKDPFGREAGS